MTLPRVNRAAMRTLPEGTRQMLAILERITQGKGNRRI